jgi:hypothetical protein
MSKTNALTLPFWVIAAHELETPAPCARCLSKTHAPVAFSDATHAMHYLRALRDKNPGVWRIRLVDSAGLMLFAADLHHHGVPAIPFDPQPDGTGGIDITLAELLALPDVAQSRK